ncbi:MAG: hypothetical protein J6A29_05980 [Clostridia bacterium]|nr:hypothetical protein [Clostridia bacterium]
MNKIEKKNNMHVILASIFMAAIPLLAPYALFGVSIIWILGLLYIIYVIIFVDHAKIYIDKKIISYFSFPIISLIISLNGFLVLNNIINLLHQLIGSIFMIIILYFLWQKSDYHIVLKASNIIAYICGIYAIIQLVMILTGNSVPSGRIKFLQLVQGQTWVPETWGFRLNSLFSEPSYFALYLLPLFAASFIKLNYKNIFIFAFLIVLSSSSLGIIGMFFVIIWQIVFANKGSKYKINSLICILTIMGILFIIVANNAQLNKIFSRTFDKLYNINDSSNSIRLSGHINYFRNYNTKEMLFGVGASQFQNYFAELGINLSNYSNSIVMIILQYGLLGAFFAIIYYIYLGREAKRKKSMIFFWILIIAMAVDYVLFSYRYYYLLYFALFCIQDYEDEKYRYIVK